MAASPSPYQNGNTDHILRPRPVKPGNPNVLRTQSQDNTLKPALHADTHLSGVSSGRSTPIPDDAPPSAIATSSARKHVRAQQKHRIFPTVEYAARVSHFDPRSEYRDFRGFFVLFWIGLAIMVFTTALRNIKDTGFPLRHQMWDLLTDKTWELGLSDAAMVGSTGIVVPMQMLARRSKGWLRWENCGMAIQSVFQVAWLALWVNWPFIFNWSWTAQVFFTLHTLVLLMKMHSYAFYNGHLSTTEHRLSALDHPETASTAAAVRYPSSNTQLNEMDSLAEQEKKRDDDADLTQLREDLAMELTSPLGRVTYPQNLSTYNYVDYILCPTLCYELEYPRTPNIQWLELFYKTLAVFGCIFLLTIISEEYIVPVLHDSGTRLQGVYKWSDMGLILAETISMLLFPFMITFLLVFLVIFEYLLGAFAEISCFADRHFYSDWWNSCDWLEFSREWNIPVHHFLRRHVYGASRPYVSRNTATLITFLISAFGHELIMGCITKKLRGYGFVAQMTQLPIVAIQRTRIVRSRRLFNNVLFWISMILGLSMMCALLPPTNQPFITLALSLFSERLNLASSQLQSLYGSLPASLQDYLSSASQILYNNLPHQLQNYIPLETSSSIVAKTDPTTFATAFVLPLLALLFFMSRNHWPSGGGRYSPFSHTRGGSIPRVTENDYEYVIDDGAAPYRQNRNDSYNFPPSSTGGGHPSRHTSRAEPADLDPDILILRHKGITYPLHFPAFDIAEGNLRVGDLRRVAARETKTDDPRRVKLLYKGKQLRDDHRACKEEHLKQNSEVMCVISPADPYTRDRTTDDIGNDSSSSASSTAIANGIEPSTGPRIDVDGSIIDDRPPRKRKGHRGGGRKKRREPRDSDDNNTTANTSPRDSTHLAAPSSNTQHVHTPSPSHTPLRAPSPAPPKKPSTPTEALAQISDAFHTDYLPQLRAFVERPPAEKRARDFEYKKLSEMVLAQVLLKLDGVETGGDDGLRARRKELVRETQEWLGELDRVGKR